MCNIERGIRIDSEYGPLKGQTISKANYGILNSSKKRTRLTIMSKEDTQAVSYVCFLEEFRRPYISFDIN